MAIRKFVTIEDPILRKTSRKVENFNQKLWDILDDMKETMEKAQGVGLAAVQVGLLRRVVVINVGDGHLELINPEIVETRGEYEDTEGCLSVPGEWAMVKRPEYVKVRAQNRNGVWKFYEGEGLKARCFCHEIDHLDGILYIDKISREMTEEELLSLRKENN